MIFDDTTELAASRAQVFDALMNRVEEVVPMLPNVVSTKLVSTEQQAPGVVLIVRRWQGSAKQVPALLRPFISKKSLAWTDFSVWDSNNWTCKWHIENIHSGYQTCLGLNHFTDDPKTPGGSLARLTGEFTVDGNNMPKVPKFLGRRIAPHAEKTVVGHTVENFRLMVQGAATLVNGG